jgi:hypothetical protein
MLLGLELLGLVFSLANSVSDSVKTGLAKSSPVVLPEKGA